VASFWSRDLVFPFWTLTLDDRQRRLMLAHEEEHVRARDPWLLAAAGFALVAVPWNVAAWWLVRRLRLAVEMDCDARVLGRGRDVASYGALLLAVGGRASRRLIGAAALGEPASFLEQRIRSMTAAVPHRYLRQAAGLVAIAAGALVLACEAPRPVAPQESLGGRAAWVSGTGISTIGNDAAGPVAAALIRQRYADVVARYAGTDTLLWFIADGTGNVTRQGVALWASDRVSTADAKRVVPGYDTLRGSAITLFGPGSLSKNSPPAVWLWLSNPEGALTRVHVTERTRAEAIGASARSLASMSGNTMRLRAAGGDAVETGQLLGPEHAVVVGWARAAIARFHPEYLRGRVDPPVIFWILSDSSDHIVRQTVTGRFTEIGNTEIGAQFAGMDVFRRGEWIWYFAPLGKDRDDVRVAWVHANRPN
jgi:hypothetical protein